jgi:hypothetical protein
MMLQQQQRFEILPGQRRRQNCRNSVKLAKFITILLPSEVLSNLQFRKFLQCTLAAMSSHCIPFPEAETPEIIILLKD